MMNTTVILPAAGLGSRFAVCDRASASKIEFELAHKPVFLHAIEAFCDRPDVGQVLLAVHPKRLDDFRFRFGDKLDFFGVTLIAGGEAARWETVKLALDRVAEDATHIAIHDAARPCPSRAMIDRVFAAAERYGAALPGLPMSDTVKRAEPAEPEPSSADLLDALFDDPEDASGSAALIRETIPRAGLYRVQTPQVFDRRMIVEAYAALNNDNAEGITDDASVAERAGHPVFIVEGDPMNLKLTLPGDAELLEAVTRLRHEQNARAAATRELFGDDDPVLLFLRKQPRRYASQAKHDTLIASFLRRVASRRCF
ncbi:MAG: IspD/TarI family cytidylyltransferase [Phycisphaeraceae bacterium]